MNALEVLLQYSTSNLQDNTIQINRQHRLLTRCDVELRAVLDAINSERVPHDGDDFHELLRDLKECTITAEVK